MGVYGITGNTYNLVNKIWNVILFIPLNTSKFLVNYFMYY